MPVNANFYYSGLGFSKFIAGWSTSPNTCTVSCQAYYSNSQSASTNVPYAAGTMYFTAIAYDINNNVLASISSPFTVNFPYYPPFQPSICTPQFLNTYQCLGGQLQQLYQGANCNTQWMTSQNCVSGCYSPSQSVGYCLGGVVQPQPVGYIQPSGCQAQYTGNYFCADDFLARKYQESDCSVGTRIQQYCVNGCLEGNCLPPAGKSSVQLNSVYTAAACDVTAMDFKIKNNGGTQSDFKINASGDASAWLRFPAAVTLDKGEEKTLTGLISVPCDAKGSKAFSISVKDGTTNTQNSMVTVAGENVAPVTPSIPALIGLAAIAFVLVLLYRSGLLKRYMRSYKRAEESF
ncbi:hypothetical protein EPN87_01160 [archaeon]|nr:MAG: hypothetical protein EPN87_01160 [archaeon]